MNEKDKFVDYYKVLECDRSASCEELKKNYQRMALKSHPDKKDKEVKLETFCLIQEAWAMLRDPETRKQYDAQLSCHEHNNLLLYDTVSLKDMEHNDCGVYTYSCRCGGLYYLENCDTLQEKLIIGCDECSFSIQVNL